MAHMLLCVLYCYSEYACNLSLYRAICAERDLSVIAKFLVKLQVKT